MSVSALFAPRRYSLRGSINATARVLLALIIVGSVLAIGTVHVPVLAVISLAATACAALSLLGGAKVGTSPFVWIVLALLVFTLLQAAPVPFELLRRLAPINADVWAGALSLLKAPQTAAPLSLDPGATLVEALKLWTYFCVLVSAAAATTKRGAGWGATVLVGAALLLTLITVAHGVGNATQVFGIYTPRLGGKGFRVAPLINPNNLAGYLSLGTAAGLSLLATAEPPIPRWITALGLTPIVGMVVLTGSRAGILALGISMTLGIWLLRPRQGEARERRALFAQFTKAAALVLMVAVMFAAAASGPRLWHLLMDDNFAKLSLARATLPLVGQHAWLGIGRGAFESVFPALHAAPDNQIYSHPENFLLQWSSEWGVPVTIAIFVGALLCLKRGAFELGSSSARRGLLAGVCAITVQNVFDLGFEVPGVMIAVVAALGFAARKRETGEPERKARRESSRRPLVAAAVAVAGVSLCAVAYRAGSRTLTVDRDLVREAMPGNAHQTGELDAFKQAVEGAIRRHPAEPYFPRLAALVAWRAKQNPLPWIDRALERGLSAGRTHYLLGAFLASVGRNEQALMELRMAATLDPALTRRIAAVCLKLTTDPLELARAVPPGPEGAQLLLTLASQLPKESEALAMALIDSAITRQPTDSRPRLGLVRRLLASIGSGSPACAEAARADCLARAQAQLGYLDHQQPRAPDLVIWKARFEMATGNPGQAVRSLEEACPRLEERINCLKAWLEAVGALRDGAALTRVARAIRDEGCGAEKACATLLWSAGETAIALGNPELALAQFEQAASQENSAGRWRSVARQAQRSGYSARALRAMDRAIALAPDDSAMVKERNALRQALLHSIP